MLKNLGVLAALMVVTSCRSSTEALLVRVDSEAAGDNCANGGAALRTGFDANNSGTLDDSEVDASKTKYVCNGATGTAGQTGQNGEQGDAGVRGLNSLNKVSMEAAGTNCANGGSKIETGLDVNDNGTLEASEVTATSYVCSQSTADDYYFGDIVIRSDDDLAQLDGKKVVFGHITIEHATAGIFTLPDLEAVVGDIYLGEGNGGGIELPAVRALTPVRELHFPKLVSTTGLYVGSYETLTTIDLPVLARAGVIRLEYLENLTAIAFPQLLTVDTFSVREMEAVTSVSVPLLTRAAVFELEYNYVLTTVTVLPSLSVANELDVYGNELLNDCFAQALRFNGTPEWYVDISDNLPNVTCTAAQICRAAMVPGVANVTACATSLSYADAQTFCGTLGTGTTLVWFASATEWAAFSSAVADGALFGDAWIGYSDAALEGTWVAAGGTSTYDPTAGMNFWAPNEPNGSVDENAAQIYRSGLVNDATATSQHPFFCRAP